MRGAGSEPGGSIVKYVSRASDGSRHLLNHRYFAQIRIMSPSCRDHSLCPLLCYYEPLRQRGLGDLSLFELPSAVDWLITPLSPLPREGEGWERVRGHGLR